MAFKLPKYIEPDFTQEKFVKRTGGYTGGISEG